MKPNVDPIMEIEAIRVRDKLTYLEAIAAFAETQPDEESVASIVRKSPPLLMKLEAECIDLRMLKVRRSTANVIEGVD